MIRILVVEDDPSTQSLLTGALKKWGYTPLCASSAHEGRSLLSEHEDIRLILLDRGLPDGDGLQICRALKADPRTRHVPVIVLTGLEELEDELGTYKSGGDIHLTKPIDLERLKRYVATFMDRIPYRGEDSDTLRCGALTLVPKSKKAIIGTDSIENISDRLFDLLYLLASKQGQAVPVRLITQKLWGGHVKDASVAVNISRLRRRLGPRFSPLIKSLHGTGYAIDVTFKPASA